MNKNAIKIWKSKETKEKIKALVVIDAIIILVGPKIMKLQYDFIGNNIVKHL